MKESTTEEEINARKQLKKQEAKKLKEEKKKRISRGKQK